MRKHFLLLFLMAILPLAGWAIEDKPQFTLSAGIVESGTNVSAAPTVTAVVRGTDEFTFTQGAVYDAAKKKVTSTQLSTSGYYYRMVYYTDGDAQMAAYVPFYVAPRVPTIHRVNNKTSFDNEVSELNFGAYWYYYGEHTWGDVWYQYGAEEADGVILYPGQTPADNDAHKTGDAYYPNTPEQVNDANEWYDNLVAGYGGNIKRSWYATGDQNANPDNFALSFGNAGAAKWKVGVKYGDADQPTWYPWGSDRNFGQNAKIYGLISVKEICTHYEIEVADFVENNLHISFVPVEATQDYPAGVPDTLTAAVTVIENTPNVEYTESYEYTGEEQKPIFTAAGTTAPDAWVYLAGGSKDNALVEGQDYEIAWTDGVGAYTTPGTKHFTVKFIGTYAGADIAKTYKITGKKITINPAYTFKTYGEADPVHPNYELDATSMAPGDQDNQFEEITKYLLLKRVEKEGNDGEDVGAYQYYIGFSDDYYTKCKYEITILQENSNLVITKAALKINVLNYWKKYNAADPTTFTWEVAQDSELKNGDTVDDVNITITRLPYEVNEETFVSEDVNATLNDQGTVATKNVEIPTYAFKGESKNYTVTFGNEFLIVPTDNIEGITVTVKNNAGEAEINPLYNNEAKYTYTGLEIRPGDAESAYRNDLVVMDGTTVLTTDDYEVESYTNNVHASNGNNATVTVAFKGSYKTTQKKVGTFTIEKAKLYVYPKSHTLAAGDPDPQLTLKYGKTVDTNVTEYWVNDEGDEDGPAAENGPKDFVAPTVKKTPLQGTNGYKLTLEGGSAADYTLDLGEGAITYGQTLVRIYADDNSKTFGAEDPAALTWKVYQVDGDAETLVTEGPVYEALGGSQPYFTIARAEGEDYGEYAITFDGPSVYPQGIVAVYIDGTFTINRKYVTLKGNDCTKVYGDENPTFAASVWDGDTKWTADQEAAAGITNGSFYYVGVQGATWNNQQQRWILQSENVNTNPGYAVQPHLFGASNIGNYSVTIANGKFTITKAPKGFGQADPQLTATAVGLKFQDQITAADTTIVREAGEAVGDYDITVAVKENRLTNYEVTCVPGTDFFHITAQEIYVVANDQAISYGQAINPYAVKILINEVDQEWTEEQIAEVLNLTTTVTRVGANKNAYTLNVTNDANYSVPEGNFKNGWLTISALKEIPLDKDSLATITSIELKQVLQDHQGRTVNVYLPGRKMDANDWYAWVLPFEVKQRDFFKEGVWGYGVMETLNEAKTTAKNVNFGVTVQPIAANTPFIVKVDENITAAEMKRMKFTGVTIGTLEYATVNPSAGAENTVQFIGFYQENEEALDATTRVLRREAAGKPMAWWPGTGIGAGQFVRTNALLQFPTEGDAQDARIFVEDPNGTTDITGVVTVNNAGVQGWYNMNGVKMQNAPVEKGVYIKDGKKVVIK